MLSRYGIKSLSLELASGRGILAPNRRDGQTWPVRDDLVRLFGSNASEIKQVFTTADGGVTAIDKGGITCINVNPTPNLNNVGISMLALQAYREALHQSLHIPRGVVRTGFDLQLEIPITDPRVNIEAGKTQLKIDPLTEQNDRFRIVAASSGYVPALRTATKGLWMCLPPAISGDDPLVDNSEAGVRELVANEVMGTGSWDDIPQLWTDAIQAAHQAQDAVVAGQLVLSRVSEVVPHQVDA